MDVKTEQTELPLRLGQIPPDPKQIVKSIDDLTSLAVAIEEFKRRFDELHKHIGFIENAIDCRLSGASPSKVEDRIGVTLSTCAKDLVPAAGKTDGKNGRSEIQRHCETMCSRGLRKYVFNNISDMAKLREEVPTALRLAKNPAKLALDSIGRFYLQGSKAYASDSPMIPARKASVLVLECFLLTYQEFNHREIEIEKSVKEEAETGAVAWRKRLLIEGGLAKADEMDARGLLFLVSGFGIPTIFKNDDLKDLIRMSKPNEISDALRWSPFLVPRIPGIIEGMVKHGKQIDAVHFAYTFGLEEKYSPQTLLKSFLDLKKENFDRMKRKPHLSPMALKDANEKLLSALKSVGKCLESHNLDPEKILPGWQIKEMIIQLEKDVADLSKRVDEISKTKRRMEEFELRNQEMKRPRFVVNEATLLPPTQTLTLHDHRFPGHSETLDISALVNSYLNQSSASYGSPNIGTLPRNAPSHVGIGSSHPAGIFAEGVLFGTRDAAFIDRSTRQSFIGAQPPLALPNLLGQSASAGRFAGGSEYSPVTNRNLTDVHAITDIAAAGNETRRSSGIRGPIL